MWITQTQAAEILGCHVSLVGKLVAKGELISRGRTGRASLDRNQVLELRTKRAQRNRLSKAKPREHTEPPRCLETPFVGRMKSYGTGGSQRCGVWGVVTGQLTRQSRTGGGVSDGKVRPEALLH